MAGLSGTLQIAKNTLLNQQILIQTATHNIANADNKAYARQRVSLATNIPYRIQAGWIGTGAMVEKISQVRDEYIEQQLMTSLSRESDYRTRSSYLEQIGTYLMDDGEVGISMRLRDFWDSWDSLSQNPPGLTEREQVITNANNLVETIRQNSSDLETLSRNIQNETGSTVDTINTLVSQIASYNQEIMSLEVTGKNANDLRDARYQTLLDLTEMLQVSYREETDGSLTLDVSDGAATINLVSHQHEGQLHYSSATQLVSYTDAGGSTITPASNSLSGGSLNGLLIAREKTQVYQDRLNTFTAELITQVNSAHGTQPVFDGTSAADILVNAAFQTAATVNADQALAISELQHTRFAALDSSRFVEYLGAIQQQIGLEQADSASRADFNEALSLQLESLQQSTSGVSIDEEMIDLIKFQQVYQAAAKVVSVTHGLLTSVIDMVR
jgi:flagellar hook-associated protein 1